MHKLPPIEDYSNDYERGMEYLREIEELRKQEEAQLSEESEEWKF